MLNKATFELIQKDTNFYCYVFLNFNVFQMCFGVNVLSCGKVMTLWSFAMYTGLNPCNLSVLFFVIATQCTDFHINFHINFLSEGFEILKMRKNYRSLN